MAGGGWVHCESVLHGLRWREGDLPLHIPILSRYPRSRSGPPLLRSCRKLMPGETAPADVTEQASAALSSEEIAGITIGSLVAFGLLAAIAAAATTAAVLYARNKALRRQLADVQQDVVESDIQAS